MGITYGKQIDGFRTKDAGQNQMMKDKPNIMNKLKYLWTERVAEERGA
jgi:hypothetical protein